MIMTYCMFMTKQYKDSVSPCMTPHSELKCITLSNALYYSWSPLEVSASTTSLPSYSYYHQHAQANYSPHDSSSYFCSAYHWHAQANYSPHNSSSYFCCVYHQHAQTNYSPHNFITNTHRLTTLLITLAHTSAGFITNTHRLTTLLITLAHPSFFCWVYHKHAQANYFPQNIITNMHKLTTFPHDSSLFLILLLGLSPSMHKLTTLFTILTPTHTS